jgi:hypothetical protein
MHSMFDFDHGQHVIGAICGLSPPIFLLFRVQCFGWGRAQRERRSSKEGVGDA